MELEQVKRALIDAARRAGIEEYEIYYQSDESVSAETLQREISSFSFGVESGISFRCIVNGHEGYASGEVMTEDAMEELVRRALSNAACIDSEDEHVIFEGSEHYATLTAPVSDLCDAVEIREAALRSMERTYAADPRVADGTECGAFSSVRSVHLLNSKGLSLSGTVGVKGVYSSAIVRDGEDAAEAFEFGEGFSDADIASLARTSVERAASKLGGGELDTGKYDVLFDGRVFREFLSAFSPIFSAKNAQQGLSLLAGKEGERVAAEHVTFMDDPMREGNPMQAAFDGEGVATERRALIDHGVLTTLLYDLTTAKRAGRASTGNGRRARYSSPVSISPYNLSILPGERKREELLSSLGDGIFITEAKGFHAGADAVTGDFSIESAGFTVKNGVIGEPVKSFTVAGNFFDLIKEIEALGESVYWGIPSLTAFGSPDVLVRCVSVAGKDGGCHI